MEQRLIPSFPLQDLFDTADMVAFLGYPRALKVAVKHLLGIEISKQVRKNMDGKRWMDLTDAEQTGLLDYARDDSQLSLQLAQKHRHQWPDWEQDISRLNREVCWRGIHIDRAAVSNGLTILRAKRDEAAKAMPWSDTTASGNRAAFLAHVAKLGLPVPRSLNKNDPEMQAWIKRYAPEHPFIQARMVYASINGHIGRLEGMLERSDPVDGVMRYESKYYGAHTGRCSGKGREGEEGGRKVNLYNVPKGDKQGLVHGVNIRGLCTARPGRKYLIFDYCQIEPRVLQWIAGNRAFLAAIEDENIYQVAAKRMGWCLPTETDLKAHDPSTYLRSKASTLGLGFRMGATKFVGRCEQDGIKLAPVPREQWNLDRRAKFMLRNVARLDWTNPALEAAVGTFLASDSVVQQWRGANAEVVRLWENLEQALSDAAQRGVPFHAFRLPSGRMKVYWKPHVVLKANVILDAETGEASTTVDRKLSASLEFGDIPEHIHGGVLAENLVQSIARDIMFFGALAVVKECPRWDYGLNCYDELMFEVDQQDAVRANEVIPYLLCNAPALKAWTAGLPISVEGGIADRYTKWEKDWRVWPGTTGFSPQIVSQYSVKP
jgi:hypothetical protein